MRKQILAVMVGLTVILGGCSKQSAQNTESTDSKQSIENIENILQEVKKDTKEIKSGKAYLMLSIYSDNSEPEKGAGYERRGDEKFDALELAIKGKFLTPTKNLEIEDYVKDGVYYTKTEVGSKGVWQKSKVSTDNKHVLNFKTESLNNKDGILNLLDNKDNWDVIKDGDKVTFKLKKTDELKNKVKEERFKSEKNLKFSEFDYTIEYVFNTKTNDIEKLVYEVNSKTEGATSKTLYKGSLEEINKEVKVEVPEEAKKALEKKA